YTGRVLIDINTGKNSKKALDAIHANGGPWTKGLIEAGRGEHDRIVSAGTGYLERADDLDQLDKAYIAGYRGKQININKNSTIDEILAYTLGLANASPDKPGAAVAYAYMHHLLTSATGTEIKDLFDVCFKWRAAVRSKYLDLLFIKRKELGEKS